MTDAAVTDAARATEPAARVDDLAGALDELNVSDLYLACGCALGDPRALAAFEDAMFREVDAAIAAQGPGTVCTAWPASRAARTSL